MHYINDNFRNIAPSSTLTINEISKNLEEEGSVIYKFGLGQSPFPVPEQMVKDLRRYSAKKDYLDVSGLLELRQAVAKYHSKKNRVNYNSENVLIGPGSKELLYLSQMIISGITILPAPSWVSYAPQAKFLSKRVEWIKCNMKNNWHIDPEELAKFCSENKSEPKILILNSPNNPTGTTHNRLEDLASIAKDYNLIVISDEIYAELDFSGTYKSLSHYYPQGTIISGGISKWCGAGGWRLGTMVFPEELNDLRTAIRSVSSETFTSVSAPIQYAAINAYNTSHDRYLWASRESLAIISEFIFEELSSVGIECIKPEGGFYILCDFSKVINKSSSIRTSKDLCKKMLAELNFANLPGSDFGLPDDDLITRMAFVDFDGSAVLKRFSNDKKFEKEEIPMFFPKIYEGIKKLVKWAKEQS